MRHPKFRLSRQAVNDLKDTADFLGEQSPASAERVLDALLRTFELLAENPDLGAIRDDLQRGIRMFVATPPADSYITFYYPIANGIEIADVIHSARDWVGMFARGER